MHDQRATAHERMDAADLSSQLERIRPELLGYLTRLVVRAELAEEIVQTAALRALESDRRPATAAEVRPWLFRIATNLALDQLRHRARWGETRLQDARTAAEGDRAFVAASAALRGTPETDAIAREHLVVCLACVLRNLDAREAAALLLVEVYSFAVDEAAEILESRFAQVKSWIQSARATLSARYERTCSLLGKQGMCFQCVELDGFFHGHARNPLAGSAPERATDDRLRIARELASRGSGPWHRLLGRVLDDLGE